MICLPKKKPTISIRKYHNSLPVNNKQPTTVKWNAADFVLKTPLKKTKKQN